MIGKNFKIAVINMLKEFKKKKNIMKRGLKKYPR